MAERARTRLTASERRDELLAAAMTEFAATGYHATPTEAIAKRAGISQPYIFRLYGTKKDLFLACVERGFGRVRETFAAAVEGDPGADPLEAMGDAYVQMLADRELPLFQLQAYAACADEEIRDAVRACYAETIACVTRLSGAPPEDTHRFFGAGMLLNVIAAMDVPELAEPDGWERWTRRIAPP